MGCGKSKATQPGDQDEQLTVVVSDQQKGEGDEANAGDDSQVQPFILDKSDEEISEEGSRRKTNESDHADEVASIADSVASHQEPTGLASPKPRQSFSNTATKIGKVASMWSSNKRFSGASTKDGDLVLEDVEGSASPVARTSGGRASMSIQGGFLLSTAFTNKAAEAVEKQSAAGPPKVTGENAHTGMMVALDLDVYGTSGLARFPGDAGPGVLLEDHFGDGSCWRVRWVLTNSWGIYYTGLCDEFHLFVGSDKATQEWDPEAVNARGRMPSMFFCVAPPKEAEDREELIRYSSPRSRVLTSEEMF